MHARLARELATPSEAYVPLRVDGHVAGYVDRARAARLADFDRVFVQTGGELAFVAALDTPSSRSGALAEVARSLAGEGRLTAWRDELYAVAPSPGAPEWFLLERAAARYFGIVTHAAHVNGIIVHALHVNGMVDSSHTPRMWLARRSLTKAIDPGQLDNLVGGGVRAGVDVRETVLREAWEEAGIAENVAGNIRNTGVVRICRSQPDGLQREIIYTHDLMLDAAWQPAPVDGEVVAHRLASFEDVAELVATDRGQNVVTADASLVIVDCLLRHGALAADAGGYLALANLRWPALTPGPAHMADEVDRGR